MQGDTARSMAAALGRPGRAACVNIFLPCEVLHALNIPPVLPEGLSCYLVSTAAERVFVEAAEERGVVLLDHGSGSYMFALEEGAAELLDLIPGDAELVTGHALWCLPLLAERLGLHGRKTVRSAAWTASQESRLQHRGPPTLPMLSRARAVI